MIAIILASSEEVKQIALKNGFREEVVLIKSYSVMSTQEEKSKIESELFKMRPYQFLVSDYWGMGHE